MFQILAKAFAMQRLNDQNVVYKYTNSLLGAPQSTIFEPIKHKDCLNYSEIIQPRKQKLDQSFLLKKQQISCFFDKLSQNRQINPISHTNSQQFNEQKSQTQNKQQFTINKESIDTLQFQSNNKIQDRLVSQQLSSIDAYCFCVFDGHGGSSLADYAAETVVKFIDQYIEKNLPYKHKLTSQNHKLTSQNHELTSQNHKQISQNQKLTRLDFKLLLQSHKLTSQNHLSSNNQLSNIDSESQMIMKAIESAYQQIQDNFYQTVQNQFKTGNKQIIKIGSCALTVIIYKDNIIIANSGDSEAIIVTKNHQEYSWTRLNQPLSLKNSSQRQRLIKKYQNVDSQILLKNKQNKLYLKGFLQPTRTLGDYYLKKQKYYSKIAGLKTPFKGPYLSCKPDLQCIKIQPNFSHMIIGSDGLWDFLSKKQIIQIIKSRKQISYQQLSQTTNDTNNQTTQDQQKLSQRLRDKVLDKCAKKKNKTKEQLMNIPIGQRRNYCDDISIVTVMFQNQPN